MRDEFAVVGGCGGGGPRLEVFAGILLSLAMLPAAVCLPLLVRGSAEPFRSAAGWAGVGCGVLGTLGVMMSQVSPVFGSIIDRFGEPLSPARLTLIPAHVLAFGLVGLIVGGAAGGLKAHSDRGKP